MFPASGIGSAADFASRVDQWVIQVFGPASAEAGERSRAWVESMGRPAGRGAGVRADQVARLLPVGDGCRQRSKLDDYDRACAVEDLAGVVALGEDGGEALVLPDEPASSCYLAEQRAFVRWLAADSEADLIAAAEAVLTDPTTVWQECGIWETDGP